MSIVTTGAALHARKMGAKNAAVYERGVGEILGLDSRRHRNFFFDGAILISAVDCSHRNI